jgi:hypothetical protein
MSRGHTRAVSEGRMYRRQRMCESCPFRGADDAYKREAAPIPPDDWPCHSEGHFGQGSDIQCRGHFEARRKFPTREGLEAAPSKPAPTYQPFWENPDGPNAA